MSNIDLNKYKDFVQAVTSEASNVTEVLITRMRELQTQENINVALLNTASTGLGSEGGEFQEIVKKMLFQGKPFNEENRFFYNVYFNFEHYTLTVQPKVSSASLY